MKTLIHECETLKEAIELRRSKLSKAHIPSSKKESRGRFLDSLEELLQKPENIPFEEEVRQSFLVLTKNLICVGRKWEEDHPKPIELAILLNQHILSNQIKNMNNQFKPKETL